MVEATLWSLLGIKIKVINLPISHPACVTPDWAKAVPVQHLECL